ncbi:UNVERIFIED_CONTAM: hypothetical protein Sradi_1990000, partial [Sesamum radiatum]
PPVEAGNTEISSAVLFCTQLTLLWRLIKQVICPRDCVQQQSSNSTSPISSAPQDLPKLSSTQIGTVISQHGFRAASPDGLVVRASISPWISLNPMRYHHELMIVSRAVRDFSALKDLHA